MSAIEPSRIRATEPDKVAVAPGVFPSTMRNRLGPARGIVLGLLIGLAAWIALGAVVLLVWVR